MRRYLVQWEIEIEADDPVEAIRQAREMMPTPGNDTTANYFTVEDRDRQMTLHFDRTEGDEWEPVDE